MILCERVKTTEQEVRGCAEGEEDEEDGAQAQVAHRAAVGTGTGALHPDVQGLLRAQELVLDEGSGQVGVAVVMDHCQRLPGISWRGGGRMVSLSPQRQHVPSV